MRHLPDLEERANQLRSKLILFPVSTIAERAGCQCEFDDLEPYPLRLYLFDQPIIGSFPALVFFTLDKVELPDFFQLLLLYYFYSADGSRLSGMYVSFADLPGGRIYAQAFQSYSGDFVISAFENDISALRLACERTNGQNDNLADLAYTFHILPRVSLQLIYWLGDEDFPSTCKILFDSTSTHYLPIDVCAILGSNLVKKIIRNKPKN